jgi:protoheme IX farnesyltransferase
MTLGAVFIYFAYRLLRAADRTWALRTYLFSLAYLALLFISMPLDRVI